MNTQQVPVWLRTLVFALAALFVLSLAWFAYANYRAGSAAWQIVVSSLVLAIPLGLMYFSTGVLVVAWWQRRRQGALSGRLAAFIYRTPRIAGILIVFFVSLFALDVFEMGLGFWEAVGAFFIHALPAIVMGVVLAVAWRWPVVGFAVFLLGSLFFLRFLLVNPLQGFGNFLLFSAPMGVIALLFWASWKWNRPALTTPGIK